MTGGRPASSSDGVNVRPCAALTPRTGRSSRDETALSLHAIDPRVDICRRRERAGERARLAHQRIIATAGSEGVGLRTDRSLSIDGEQLVRVAHTVLLEEERVEHREDDRDQAEAESDGEDDRQCGEGRTAKRAQREPDVAHDVVDEHGASRIPAFLFHPFERTERPERLRPCRIRCNTGRAKPFGFPIDVQPQLLIQFSLPAAAEEKRLQACAETVPETHGFNSPAGCS